jgi:hypothetical protein
MARNLSDIYNEIITEKESMTTLRTQLTPFPDTFNNLLSTISSGSKVAIWRLWVWLVAYAIWMFEKVQDTFKSEVEALISSTRFGTLPWYQEIALLFQYGDALTYTSYRFQYAIVDTTKQIIKRAAAVATNGQIILKVAKLTGTDPVKLTSGELTAFNAYILDLKPPGETVLVISSDADLMKLYAEIIYDPQVLNADGSSITDGSFPVEVAINAYLAGIVFDGKFNSRAWQDAVQAVAGVVDVVPGSLYGKANASASFDTIVSNYYSVAGYMIIDPANPLSSTLTYTSSV